MEKEQVKENETFTPSQYFDYLKGAKQVISTESLKNSYGSFISLAEKYSKTGQKESLKKLSFLASTLIKEEKLIELGITTFVYKDVIEDYMNNVADKSVKIVELSRYMREIPDELVDTIIKAKEIFDELYVVFTDYTGKEERKIAKERRDKDPIIFGAFLNASNVADRFYFIGDWEDEYCDLTLDKMIDEYKNKKSINPAITIKIPETSEELMNIVKSYQVDSKKGEFTLITTPTNVELPVSSYTYVAKNEEEEKKGFFAKVKSVFNKK